MKSPPRTGQSVMEGHKYVTFTPIYEWHHLVLMSIIIATAAVIGSVPLGFGIFIGTGISHLLMLDNCDHVNHGTAIQYSEIDKDAADNRFETAKATENLKSLMDLPPELRQKIYKYLLLSHKDILVKDRAMVPLINQRRPAVALLRTCKLVNSEATPILYGKNRFILLGNYKHHLFHRQTGFIELIGHDEMEKGEHPFGENLRDSTLSALANLDYLHYGTFDAWRFFPRLIPYAGQLRNTWTQPLAIHQFKSDENHRKPGVKLVNDTGIQRIANGWPSWTRTEGRV